MAFGIVRGGRLERLRAELSNGLRASRAGVSQGGHEPTSRNKLFR